MELAALSLSLSLSNEGPAHAAPIGLGDTDYSIKYNFLKEKVGSKRPAITASLNVEPPTGSAKKQLGSGLIDYYLDGVMQKTLSPKDTLRVNGRACLTRDPELLARHEIQAGKPPNIAVGVEVEEAFLHCAKAFKRSALWRPEEWPDTDGLARAAQIWRDHMALDLTTRDVQEFVDDDYANNLSWT